jgi:hypothetical protein
MRKIPLFLTVIPKPQNMKRYALTFFLLAVLSTGLVAQPSGDFGNLITGTAADSKYLAEGFITPFMRAFGYGMNNGWYNSGAPHKLGGFDLTITSANVFVPLADQSYFVDNSKMTSIERLNGSGPLAVPENGNAPTVFGSQTAIDYRSPKGAIGTKFKSPTGIGTNFLPTPALGLGIGLPLGFEIRARYVPTIDINQFFDELTGSFDLWGVGVMHDIKQWIPGVKEMPFDVSAFVGYTKLNFDLGFDSSDPTKRAVFSNTSTTIQALVGKKISVLAVYGSVGYNISNTDLALKGNYDLNDDGDVIDAQEKDPFTITTDSNGFRATVGLRLRLAVLSFHGDYTFSKYNTFTGGFGINFR